jgi:ribosomal protein S12 methylthiotransferase accessory factor YcaO
MAAAKPSQAAVANVIAALAAQGLPISGVQVDPDGGFRVITATTAPESLDAAARAGVDSAPRRWGQAG